MPRACRMNCRVLDEAPGPCGPSECRFFAIFFKIFRTAAILSETKPIRFVMSRALSFKTRMLSSTALSCAMSDAVKLI